MLMFALAASLALGGQPDAAQGLQDAQGQKQEQTEPRQNRYRRNQL